ncbi:MAG TPA: hypothetical protein PK890_11715 [Terrimesophilobacter sp.]|nr:hypothetical protein [Terrimesophilobacter sp.]
MLSDEDVKAFCAEHGFVFGVRERRLVRAVEAAVRADQIEKDAAIAKSEIVRRSYSARSDLAAAIRAQQNGDSNAE